MKFKLIMENWRKTIQENEWSPLDILEAIVEDYGFTVHNAPDWMKYAVDFFHPNVKPDVWVYSAYNEDQADIFWTNINHYFNNNMLAKEKLLHRPIAQFLKKTAETLDIPAPTFYPDFFPITKLGMKFLARDPEWASMFNKEFDAFLVPHQRLADIIKMHEIFLDDMEDDFEAFLYNNDLLSAHQEWEEIMEQHDENSWDSPVYDAEQLLRDMYVELSGAAEDLGS